MALEKVISEDKIEIVGPYKAVQIRTCTQVLEDGVELSSGYHQARYYGGSGLQQRVSRSTSYLCGCAYP
jgi:hypothetical protein